METKDEIIRLVQELAHEAKYGWAVQDGLVTAYAIRMEQHRIDRDCEKIIKYIKEYE